MVQLIKLFLETITPSLRTLIIDFVKSLSTEASKTPNPWDDILVSILKTILDIKD